MKRFLNYVGQLRLYSLADLILLLIAIQASLIEGIGIVLLHLAFLAFLENRHSHSYRAEIPLWLSYILAVIGLVFYRKIEGFLYLFFGFLYTKKTKNLGSLSPLFRGFQYLFLVAGVMGYYSPLVYLVGLLIFIRNLCGDFRDIEKDKNEHVKTMPILMRFVKNIKHIHLVATILTSIIWWSFTPLSVLWLVLVLLIEISTYNLTSR